MQFPKAKGREILFLLLYSLDFTREKIEGVERLIADQLKVSVRHVHDQLERLALVQKEMGYVDAKIEAYSSEYKIARIPKVELNVLRLALYEIFYDDGIPNKVAISEGIRLARKFGNQESFKFVNALLDAIPKSHEVFA